MSYYESCQIFRILVKGVNHHVRLSKQTSNLVVCQILFFIIAVARESNCVDYVCICGSVYVYDCPRLQFGGMCEYTHNDLSLFKKNNRKNKFLLPKRLAYSCSHVCQCSLKSFVVTVWGICGCGLEFFVGEVWVDLLVQFGRHPTLPPLLTLNPCPCPFPCHLTLTLYLYPRPWTSRDPYLY